MDSCSRILDSSDSSSMVQCPYNKAHHILKHRFQVHLTRCRRSYPNSDKVTCPFNVTHILNAPEMKWHTENCPSRSSFDLHKYSHDKSLGDAGRLQQEKPRLYESVCASSENWDDANYKSYDPEEYTTSNPVLRMMKGGKPSEKKAFRMAEWNRINSMKN